MSHTAERVINNLLDQIEKGQPKAQAPLPLAPCVRKLKNEGAYAVLAAATALEQQGKNIVHLEIGQPDFPTPKHIVEAGVAALTGGETTYSNPSGTADIKEAIAEFVSKSRGVKVTPDQVVVGPGCKPGLFFAAQAIIEAGDEVILPDPCFPTYTNMVDVAGGKCVMCPLDSQRRCFDMVALEALMTPKTRLLMVNR
jgi:aspartate/methionine/tyrosine aminotransferase